MDQNAEEQREASSTPVSGTANASQVLPEVSIEQTVDLVNVEDPLNIDAEHAKTSKNIVD